MGLYPIPLEERLADRWTVTPDGCWEWKGDKRNGYGTVYVNGRRQYAHRAIYELHRGPLDGAVLRHRCDNPPCVNPDHLVPGTQADNMADCSERGRWRNQYGTAAGTVMPPIRAHGTNNGYGAHLKRGEKPCDACWTAHSVYMRAYREALRLKAAS